MKKSRFTESQIVAILKEGEAGLAVARLARKYGISAAPYYHWKSKYAGTGLSPSYTVIYGVAAPVKTPLLGQVRKP